MLKNYVVTTSANTSAIICMASGDMELAISSIVLNGGANGGEVTLSFSTGFEIPLSIAAGDVIVLDNKMNLPGGTNLSVKATTDGIKVMVSANEWGV